MAQKILIVDDDPHIREVVTFAIEKSGMRPLEAQDGEQALTLFEASHPDLIVLDINMPEKDGLEVCKGIRKTSNVPILFLSSRDEEIDRILGLELGADDYLVKPFSPRELVARVKAILKRCSSHKEEQKIDTYRHGSLTLEPFKHEVFWNNKPINLTATEFSILHGMIRQPERVFERDQIMDMAYDNNIHVSDRTIDSHVRHIRKKFSESGCDIIIETIRGVGYKLSA